MMRLELMPLVPDFGESLQAPFTEIDPNVRLKFTRDDRIFDQFSNFPGANEEQLQHIIQTRPLPDGLTVATASEEDGVTFGRRDESGEMNWLFAWELKTLVIPEDASPVNKATKAYLDQLPDDAEVVLRWD